MELTTAPACSRARQAGGPGDGRARGQAAAVEHGLPSSTWSSTAPLTSHGVAGTPGHEVVETRVGIYRSVSWEHSDGDDFRNAMVREHRLVVTIRPERPYGMLPRR